MPIADEELQDAWDEAKLTILRAITKMASTEAPASEEVNNLAEAYAWLQSTNQPH